MILPDSTEMLKYSCCYLFLFQRIFFSCWVVLDFWKNFFSFFSFFSFSKLFGKFYEFDGGVVGGLYGRMVRWFCGGFAITWCFRCDKLNFRRNSFILTPYVGVKRFLCSYKVNWLNWIESFNWFPKFPPQPDLPKTTRNFDQRKYLLRFLIKQSKIIKFLMLVTTEWR